MSPRTLKIALAASVALNLFAAAAGATLLVGRADVERRIDAQHRAPRDRSFMAVVEGLDPAVRERVRDTLRASAREARPDFEETRLKRRQATALVRSGEFEADAVAVLATLEPDDRAALSEILTRRGRVVVRDKGDRKGREDRPRTAN